MIIGTIAGDLVFQGALSRFDTRASVCTCDQCEIKMENPNALENHMRILHGILIPKRVQDVPMSQEQNLLKLVMQSQSQNVKPPMLVKSPDIPIWNKEIKFDYFKSQVETWDEDNKESEKRKFDRLVESFKKNNDIKDLKAFASSLILSKLRTSEKQTVKEVLKLMEERYGRT